MECINPTESWLLYIIKRVTLLEGELVCEERNTLTVVVRLAPHFQLGSRMVMVDKLKVGVLIAFFNHMSHGLPCYAALDSVFSKLLFQWPETAFSMEELVSLWSVIWYLSLIT